MLHKDTVAIIGAASNVGRLITKGICPANYRLLLMDKNAAQLSLLTTDIITTNKTAEIGINKCSKNASWEADIIIVAVAGIEQMAIAEKIKEVATQKIVLLINPLKSLNGSTQQFLPNSKEVYVFITDEKKVYNNSDKKETAFIEGKNEEAMRIAKNIMNSIGYNCVVKKIASTKK